MDNGKWIMDNFGIKALSIIHFPLSIFICVHLCLREAGWLNFS